MSESGSMKGLSLLLTVVLLLLVHHLAMRLNRAGKLPVQHSPQLPGIPTNFATEAPSPHATYSL